MTAFRGLFSIPAAALALVLRVYRVAWLAAVTAHAAQARVVWLYHGPPVAAPVYTQKFSPHFDEEAFAHAVESKFSPVQGAQLL